MLNLWLNHQVMHCYCMVKAWQSEYVQANTCRLYYKKSMNVLGRRYIFDDESWSRLLFSNITLCSSSRVACRSSSNSGGVRFGSPIWSSDFRIVLSILEIIFPTPRALLFWRRSSWQHSYDIPSLFDLGGVFPYYKVSSLYKT